MKTASKIVAKDSCNYALNKGNSNETNIKVTQQIASLFGYVPKDGESYEVKFAIEKNDFLISLCKIMTALPLYSPKGIMIRFSETLFNSKLQDIEDFFGEEKIKNITANLTKPNKHPLCLNFGSTKFSIRDFLVEGRSILTFKENDGNVKLQIEYNKNAVLDFEKNSFKDNESPLQQIFYGAPGTGKSHIIKEKTEKEANTIRTTFHPDTDYASFVGSYKPTTIEEPVMTVIGTKAVPVENPDGTPRIESKIVYEFVNQSFLKAYINAWKNFKKVKEAKDVEKQFLIIEEINRGNCAQIFGDLFQLLDRNDTGFSDYPIVADADMQKQLKKHFNGLDIPLRDSINALYEEGDDIVSKVLDGQILLLPNNLYIWATMNTSDQSLFPIDSAFKRRWDWEYMPISNAHKGWTISVNNNKYDWWEFLIAINQVIGKLTSSEDKKLGYFFCKAKDEDKVISAKKFVGKVIFYLWNDVFKDYEFEGEIFTDHDDNKKLTFDKFYTTVDNQKSTINEQKVEMFLQNLGLEPLNDESYEEDDKEEDEIEEDNEIHKSLKITLNGTVIQEKSSISTFVKAIEMIGVEKVAALDMKISSYKLLSKKEISYSTPGGYGHGLRKLGDYWMITKYSNNAKIKYLYDIKEALGLNLEATIE